MKILRFENVVSYDIQFGVNIRHSIRRSILLKFGQTIDGISRLRLYFDAELVVIPREQARGSNSTQNLSGFARVGRASSSGGGGATGSTMAVWHPSMSPATDSDNNDERPSIGTLRTFDGGPFVHLPTDWYQEIYHLLQTESPLNCTVARIRDGEDPVDRFFLGNAEDEPIGEGPNDQ